MSSATLLAVLQRLHDNNPGIRSLTLVRHDHVVLDAYISPFSTEDRHDIHSCTKSVLSALVGIALDRQELPPLDTHVLSFFADRQIDHLDERKRALTLGHLLTMSAGLQTEDSYLYDWAGLQRMRQQDDWAQYVLDLPMQAAPGTRFEYSNCVSELIAIILQQATGRSLEAYAREHLFGPLGIVDLTWQGSRPGDSWGFSGLSMRPLDLARLGSLYLHGGEWHGTRVLPEEWVTRSTSPQIEAGTLAQGYGYQWWVDDDMFMMQGHGGQFVYVMPALDLVVVFTSALPQRGFFIPRRLLANSILPAVVADHALPASPMAAELDRMVQRLGSGSPEELHDLPELARWVSGRSYRFAENAIGLQGLSLEFTADSAEAQATVRMRNGAMHLTIGMDGVYRISELNGQHWAYRGAWVDARTFVLEQEIPSKVFRRRTLLEFDGDNLISEVQDLISGAVERYQATVARD